MSHFKNRQNDKEPPSVCFKKCWAKTEACEPVLSVLDHCRIVGHVAQVLLSHLPPAVTSRLDETCISLIASHDVGKVSPGFQKKCPAWTTKNLPELQKFDALELNHAVISEASVAAFSSSPGGTRWSEVLGWHHGARKEKPSGNTIYRYGGTNWEKEREGQLEKLITQFGDLPHSVPSPEQLLLASGLTCVADWIGSDKQYFP